ncbi:MAG: hypothetical protein HQ512_08525 [Rhodospirillales bacterium]|nr:hypothetical protein [Rhodospirillales bacterium]
MALIIGSLALVVGLTSIWLATAATKNVEIQGETLLLRVRAEQKKTMDELLAKIAKVEKQNKILAEHLKGSSSSSEPNRDKEAQPQHV